MATEKTTRDHDVIREWADKRGGKPAEVASTEQNGQIGIIRLEFPDAPHHNDDALKEISWDEFFEKFDASGLELLYQEETAEGQQSSFNKLIYPEPDSAAGKKILRKAAGKRSGAKATGKKTASKPGPKKAAGKTTAGKTTVAKKVTAKTPAKKAAGKKTAAKKTVLKKVAAKGTPAKKTAAKKIVAKKVTGKKTAARKTVAKKTVKKAMAKKTSRR